MSQVNVDGVYIALLDVPTYSKALHRRATSSEVIGTWTSLSQADKGPSQLHPGLFIG